MGEAGAAIFVAPETHLTAQILREFCSSKLSAYKVPRYIWIVDAPLPRNATGKYVKRELQDSLKNCDAL